MNAYYTVTIPWSDTPSVWHPTTKVGPLSVLTRGAFDTAEQAHTWAATHLEGQPYDVVLIQSEIDDVAL